MVWKTRKLFEIKGTSSGSVNIVFLPRFEDKIDGEMIMGLGLWSSNVYFDDNLAQFRSATEINCVFVRENISKTSSKAPKIADIKYGARKTTSAKFLERLQNF